MNIYPPIYDLYKTKMFSDLYDLTKFQNVSTQSPHNETGWSLTPGHTGIILYWE